jgi:serine phosphatase RsbU (regulator of sigma subunit)
MATTTLKKMLGKGKSTRLLLEALLSAVSDPLAILDDHDQLLLGRLPVLDGMPDGLVSADGKVQTGVFERAPVTFNSEIVGSTVARPGSQWARRLASLLVFQLEQEDEKRALAAEVLDMYRELHLLYRLSEKLVSSPHPEAIARIALNEASPLIPAQSGMVLLVDHDEDGLILLASCGAVRILAPGVERSTDILGRVLQSGEAELAIAVPAGEIFTDMEGQLISLLCAPLKSEQGVFGAILMAGEGQQQYNAGELKLLSTIALQTAPAIEIAHLHQMELEHVRMERDLQVARQVQSGLLPRSLPEMPGWHVDALWQPAQAVGGDFYDFLRFQDGRIGLVIADVSNKGVPAALVMANTRSILRAVVASASSDCCESPGKLLAQVNDILCQDMPRNMFVTCFLSILDTASGRLSFANAGQNLPYQRATGGVTELFARGMPLGLFPGMEYEEMQTILQPGDSILMYSDGLVEAHNPQGEMFGEPRLESCLAETDLAGQPLIEHMMATLEEFTGPGWEQEDDVTFVTLERLP